MNLRRPASFFGPPDSCSGVHCPSETASIQPVDEFTLGSIAGIYLRNQHQRSIYVPKSRPPAELSKPDADNRCVIR